MKSYSFFFFACLVSFVFGEPYPDTLHFRQGDFIHGQFHEFHPSQQLKWQRSDETPSLTFPLTDLHSLLINKGTPLKQSPHRSTITLSNGDQLSYSHILFEKNQVQLESDLLGSLVVPLDLVSSIHPHPDGEKLLYHGPYHAEKWRSLYDPEAYALLSDDEKEPFWHFRGNAWYSNSKALLQCPVQLPLKARVRLLMEWRGSISTSLVLYGKPYQNEKPSNLSKKIEDAYDTGYVMQIQHSYVTLQKIYRNAKGVVRLKRMITNSPSYPRLTDQKGKLEVRSDLTKGKILLFLGDQFVAQWSDPSPLKELGNEFCIKHNNYSKTAKLKISNLTITHWNGIIDSAMSLTHPKKDIILLANGLDRMSGTLKSITDTHVVWDNDYTTLNIPLTEVVEIKRASRKVLTPSSLSKKSYHFMLGTRDRLTLSNPISQKETISADSLLGPISFSQDYLSEVFFSQENNPLSHWNDQF